MKIRNGFVSNSSSSSFCIYGACLEVDEVIEKLKSSLTEDELASLDEEGDWYIQEILEGKTDLSVYLNEDTLWIGKSWSEIGDDQTGKEFKNSVLEQVTKFLDDVGCDTYEEEIYS